MTYNIFLLFCFNVICYIVFRRPLNFAEIMIGSAILFPFLLYFNFFCILYMEKNTICAPHIQSNQTCFHRDDLLILIHSYNQHHKDKIPYKKKSVRELWNALHEKLKSDCNTEYCWLEQPFVSLQDKKCLEEHFKPKRPKEWEKNPYEWLSTDDINKVMKQYEKKYKDFLFLGAVPSDCHELKFCSLHNLDVSILIDVLHKKKIGIIYNLDTYQQPGSHWVSVYADFQEGIIFYIDSGGQPPIRRIHNFLLLLKEQLENYYKEHGISKNVKIFISKTQFQKGNSECGMFSMYFILSQLQGKSSFHPKQINDKKMSTLRNIFYL